ncbi:hypothetical protein niasHT_037348 [Heterodera trifolii]|uniref:Uncharacterized protein n=1 Tax=Heterodera trifolii TaxID=157864 RepID=A0ABD2J454_9BILA
MEENSTQTDITTAFPNIDVIIEVQSKKLEELQQKAHKDEKANKNNKELKSDFNKVRRQKAEDNAQNSAEIRRLENENKALIEYVTTRHLWSYNQQRSHSEIGGTTDEKSWRHPQNSITVKSSSAKKERPGERLTLPPSSESALGQDAVPTTSDSARATIAQAIIVTDQPITPPQIDDRKPNKCCFRFINQKNNLPQYEGGGN